MSEREPDPGFSVVDRRRRGEDDEAPSSGPAVAPPPSPRPSAPPQSSPQSPPQSVVVGPGPAPGGPAGAPKADLTSLLVMLYGDAMANLGQAPDPVTGRPHVDLEQARFVIDLLAILQDKTKGNLAPGEGKLLDEILYNLRMQYVAVSRGGGL